MKSFSLKGNKVMDRMLEEILEAWYTNNRINLFLIEHISEEGMKCTLSKRGGRNVVRQFAHIHNNRVWHLERRAPELARELYKFETQEEPEKIQLVECLNNSADKIAQYFQEVYNGTVARKTFKKGIVPYLGYFISHESHHRGSILLTLKECGHPLDQATRYAIWNWDNL